MSFISDWRRFQLIAWKDRRLLAEATVAIAVASIAIRAFPFRKVVGWAADDPDRQEPEREAAEREIARVRWAINALAPRLPWKIVCFQKGLALHRLLRRRGVPTRLHYGIAQDDVRGLRAHVWVTHAGSAVIGGAEAVDYTCLATFPAAPPSSAGAVPR